jgi:N-acetylneuraminic acid mutarotase
MEDLAPSNSEYWDIPVDRVEKFSDLKVGDVIIYQLGLNKNIVRYIVLGEYDSTHSEKVYEGYSKPSNIMALAQTATVKGRITSFVDGSHFTVDASGDQKHCFVRRAATYYEYNPATNTVKRSGTMPHLNVGDYVYVNLFRSDVFIVVKYVE